MRNKNGFTLIELMAVITILVILSLVIIPIIDMNVKKSKNNMYSVQLENIRNAGRNYFSDNASLQPVSGRYNSVLLSVLINQGYISEVSDPRTGEPFESNVYVQVLNDDGNYIYTVCPLEDDCEVYIEGGGVATSFKKVKDVNPGTICGTDIEEDYSNVDVCYIYSVEDLVEFSDMVNSGYNFQGKTVLLMNDLNVIDAKSYASPESNSFGDVNGDGEESESLMDELMDQTSNGFPTIGDDSHTFRGTFNGNAKRILNLYIDKNANYSGLFGYNAGVIKGVILQDAIVKGSRYVGGICGYNNGTIQSVMYDGNISGGSDVGGIVGEGYYSSLIDVIADADIVGTGSDVGGIIGDANRTTVKGVYRSGSITDSSSSVNKTTGSCSGDYQRYTVSLDSIQVGNSTPTSGDIASKTGYTVSSNFINNIPLYEQFMDTYMGGDNNGDGYYFDYNERGEVWLYSVADRPLVVSLSGKGTESNPYIINSYSDLKQVSYNLGDASSGLYYRLDSDIDFSNQILIMLSSETNPFKGTFLGQRHSLNNYTVLAYNYVGFFGSNSGTVRDLRFNNASISGNSYVGGMVGRNSGTVIGALLYDSTVTGSGRVGGIAGYNSSVVQSVRYDGDVVGYSYVGGAVGEGSYSGVYDVLIDADINAADSYVGGIIGNANRTNVKGVFRSGSVTGGNSMVNKTMGDSTGEYTFNTVALDTIKVNNTAATSANLTSETGYTVSSSFINNLPLYEQFMDTYMGGDNNGDGYYFDYDSNGNVELYHIDDRPLSISLSGSGTESSPYIINSYSDLKQISYVLGNASSGLYYRLNSDIDFSNQNLIMLSSETNPFKGTFLGQGHSINNFTVLGYNQVGLFGSNSGTIKDIRLNNANVSGNSYVGGVMGYNGGTFVGGWILDTTVSGNSDIGGIVGYCNGLVQSVRFDGSVVGITKTGGICGTAYTSGIYYVLVDADVYADNNYSAGIIGGAYYCSVSGVFRSGSVIGNSYNVKKVMGYTTGSGSYSNVALDTILVDGVASTSNDITSETGYTVDSSSINDLSYYNSSPDAYGYYYALDSNGHAELYSVTERPYSN